MTKPRPPISTAEVADQLGVTVRTVARWVDTGHLPMLRQLPGKTGTMLFDPDAVDEFAKTKLTTVTTVRLVDEAAS